MKTLILLLYLAWVFPFFAYAEPGKGDPCNYFFEALRSVPHESITHSHGEHAFLLDGKKHVCCEIKFVTNTALLSGRQVPDFRADQGSVMRGMGWRMVRRMVNSLMADGSGSSLYGTRKDSVLCLILHHQPAYIDEKKGNIIQTKTLTITVRTKAGR